MNIVRNNLNKGTVQGIVASDVYSPNDNVSVVTVRVKDSRVNPKIGRKPLFFIQFSAFGDKALELRQKCQKGQLIYIEYYLATSRKTDSKGRHVFFPEPGNHGVFSRRCGRGKQQYLIPYINGGYLQGDFVSLKNAVNAERVAFLTIRVTTEMDGRERTYYLSMSVYGGLIEAIRENYKSGDSIGVSYKIETDVKVKDGEKKYLMDYVVTGLL